jgi:hypothetical protein
LKTETLYPVTDGSAVIQVGAGDMVVLKSTTTDGPSTPNPGGSTVPPTEQPSSQVDHNKVTVEVRLDDQGTASAVITDKDLAVAIQNSTDSTVIISAKATGEAKAVKVDIPVQEFLAAGKKQVDVLQVDTGFAKVSLSSKLLEKEGATHIQLQVAQVDTSSLSAETRQQIGSTAAIYDFSLMVNGKKVTNFNGNEVKVELPYNLASGENPNKIVVYYLTDDGKLEVIKNGKYDPVTGMVAFKAKHFSKYLAAYTELSFHDLAGVKWASDAIESLAARGVVQGVGNSQFNPESQVTRAEFITMLVNAFDLNDPTASTTLVDVQPNSWYYSSIASAQKLGIVNGQTATLFGVNDKISRQDMAVMVYRTMQVMNAHSTTKNTVITFADHASISNYALEAVASMQQAGIIEGMDNGNFAPSSLATRAQAAVVIFRLFE